MTAEAMFASTAFIGVLCVVLGLLLPGDRRDS
jgi:hypothetical protein